MQYRIVEGSAYEVQRGVNKLLADGWALHGPLLVGQESMRSEHYVHEHRVNVVYAQALVKGGE